MKTRIVFLISLSVILFHCSTEEKIAKSPLWGVDYSEKSTTAFVQGAIEQQNAGPKTIYIVTEGALRPSQEDRHTISLKFENGESLQLLVTKKTLDNNYHYPGNDTENQLLSAIFCGKPLELKESSISIQARLEENKFHIITNVHTLDAGDFNGTLSRIPLLKGEGE
jgi:hypothetical protein